MTRRRTKNLSRNQKIGIGLAAVGAVGGTTALVIAMRRRKATGQLQGSMGPPGPPKVVPWLELSRAKRRFCLHADQLTLEQRVLLMDTYFTPKIAASDPALPIDVIKQSVAVSVISEICNVSEPNSATRAMALDLASSAYDNYVGIGS